MRIGIIGGGQLGRMLALAGYPLGATFSFFDTSPDAPTKNLGALFVAEYTDTVALKKFASSVDVITYEFENVRLDAAATCAELAPLYPSLEALETSQDRSKEKRFFTTLGIPTPRFAIIKEEADCTHAASVTGFPAVLKTTTLGYDGKGQRVVRDQRELLLGVQALSPFGAPRRELILEEFIRFDRELSLIAARSHSGEMQFYPLVQNTHREGILRRTLAPAPNLPATLQQQAEAMVREIMEKFAYRGVFTLELFERDGKLFANEMAPRVHNSGHWSIEGSATSQFEQHIRAIMGLPLGSPTPRGRSTMINLIGKIPSPEKVLSSHGTHMHLYGKEVRSGRKVGHITVCEDECATYATTVESLIALADGG